MSDRDDGFDRLPESRTGDEATLDGLLSAEFTVPNAPRDARSSGAAGGRQPRSPGLHRARRSTTPLLRSKAAMIAGAGAIVLGTAVTAGYALIVAPEPGTSTNGTPHGSGRTAAAGDPARSGVPATSSTTAPTTSHPSRSKAATPRASRSPDLPPTSPASSGSASSVPTATRTHRTGSPSIHPGRGRHSGHGKPTVTRTP